MKVTGIVEKGSGRGKKDFVPTVNLMLDDVLEDLDFGIYACEVEVMGDEYWGVVHYGPRTTVDNLTTFEVFIFDFDKDVYGEQIEVDVLDRLRDIVKFESEEELQNQIENDILQAKQILGLL